MKITDIKVHLVQSKTEFNLPTYGRYKPEIGIVRLFTDEGIEGNADYVASGYSAKILAEQFVSMKPHLIGQDPFNIEQIWKTTFRPTRLVMPIYVPGAINTALWDIVGKAVGQPLYRLLGAFRDRIRAYASTLTLEDLKSFLNFGESLVEQGFTAIKLHPWDEPDRDIELFRELRRVVGDKVDLMTDAMGMYNRYDALKVGRVIDDLHFYWFEEPLIEADVDGYIQLCQSLDVPVLGVDSLRMSLGNYTDYVSRGALDIVQADAIRLGISMCRKLAAIAEGFGRRFQAHVSGPPLHQAANMHIMGAISNGDLFEMPVPIGILDTAAKNPIHLEKDGWVTLPQGPGLGVELDWKELNRLTTTVVES